MRSVHVAVLCSALALSLALACGSSDESTFPNADDDAGSSSTDGEQSSGAPFGSSGGGANDGSVASSPIHLEPPDPVLTYVTGGAVPTTTFVAKTEDGTVVPATFAIDRGEVGLVGSATGLFTPSGNAGGKATVTATYGGRTTTTSVTVKLKTVDNGSAAIADAGADAAGGGSGGFGGVGGEGLGGAVSAGTLTTLQSAATADGASMLYPYDKTVWPRGILAPLLQWKVGSAGDYDAVLIKIQETNFEYEGAFAKTATPFIHHPIPQQAWKQMLSSNAGEDVTVTLTFAKGSATYGPLTLKWKIASAPLKGVVYYNSYGTKLAKNYSGAIPGNQMFGGATLAIKPGSTDPTLIAGGNGNNSQCRVCHSVAANGSVLVTQRGLGNDRAFSTYDLKTGAETPMTPTGGGAGGNAKFAWPAIYPDGTMFLGDSSSGDGSSNTPNLLYQVVSGGAAITPTQVATTGWPAGFRAAYPAFSPDGKNLAFTMFGGATGADQKTLGLMTFDKATSTWGPLTTLHKPANSQTALFPAFLPTNDAIVFHVESRYNTRDYGGTRSDADQAPSTAVGANPTNDPARRGTRAKLWWMDLATKTAVPLDNLNGKGYLPVDAANDHDDDETLNYEPTVNPVPSGGYAWVVFTSRRSYGNVATINPFFSDPRFNDLTSRPTPKKLWVAAIDLNAPAGTDPSHPAFYLPAQELLAGNSRGYWVVDPCKSDGNDCESGDECCGGFCRPDATNKLVCSNVVPVCAQEFEKCSVAADCCGAPNIQCINGRCAAPIPSVPK